MRVLFAGQNDWGSAHRIAAAMNALEPDTARVYVERAHRFFDYDLCGPGGLEEATELAHAADWIICTDGHHQSFAQLLVKLDAPSARRGILHTGTAFRTHWQEAMRKDATLGVEVRFANPDLMRFVMHASARAWPIPPIGLSGIPLAHLSGEPSVCHSPSTRRRDTKGTAKILRALGDLELHVIENVAYEKCLRLRAKHRIFIDQYNPEIGGYGKSGVEALSQGLVTFGNLCHIAPEVWERWELVPPPIHDVRDIRQLRARLEALQADTAALREGQMEAMRWARGPAAPEQVGRYFRDVLEAQ